MLVSANYGRLLLVLAGVFCAIVSHPADTIVSKLNQQKGSSISEVARKLGFRGEKAVDLLATYTERDVKCGNNNNNFNFLLLTLGNYTPKGIKK